MNFGRYFLALSILCSCYFLHGCGSGTPDTTVNISNSQNQTNDQNTVVNEGELDCSNLQCSFNPSTGALTAPGCSGSASAVIAVTSLDLCASVVEVAADNQEQTEAAQ